MTVEFKLSDLKDKITKELDGGISHKRSLKLKGIILNHLLNNKRLIRIKNNQNVNIPYVKLDDNIITQLDRKSQEIRNTFEICFGLNITTNKFAKELIDYLYSHAMCSGEEIENLAKYNIVKNDTLYFSCGKYKIVKCDINGNLTKINNGDDGILFDHNFCFPEFKIDENINSPMILTDATHTRMVYFKAKALNLNLTQDDSNTSYNQNIQLKLLYDWLLCVTLGNTPLPMLVCIGNKGSGKTITARAITKLFLGTTGDISSPPKDSRTISTLASSTKLYSIDNLDTKVDNSVEDMLSMIVTGGSINERELFTNAEIFNKQVVANLIITTRSGDFASRADIKERTLPLYFGERTEYNISDDILIDEIIKNRDLMLTHLIKESMLNYKCYNKIPFNSSIRFSNFSKMISSRNDVFNVGDVNDILLSLIKTQFISINDNDPLLSGILNFDYNKVNKLEGTPIEIVRILEKHMGYKNHNGYKTVSRKIKEYSSNLKLLGWSISSSKFGNSTKFTIVPPINENLIIKK